MASAVLSLNSKAENVEKVVKDLDELEDDVKKASDKKVSTSWKLGTGIPPIDEGNVENP